ncbi:MAG: hypothetical protein K2X32_11310 [Phycisphaerales bacterium]|nr:hypothetical protein [Phycisphaerales bacterium]
MSAIAVAIIALACTLLISAGAIAAGLRSEISPPTTPAVAPSPDTTRAATNGRVVHFFNFEEQDENPDPIPLHWFRAQNNPPDRVRPGFPVWNLAAFSSRYARSGNTSVMLPTLGGSTSLRLSAGMLPIFPAADYIVTGVIRTSNLNVARAAISCRLLDAQRRPIASTETRSPLVLSPDDWTPVALKVLGSATEAAFLQIDLELLQPRDCQTPSIVGKHQVWEEDLTGAAFFDDVGVFQLPRLSISPASGGPVVNAPSPLTFTAVVRDLTGEDISAQFVLRNLDGDIIASETIQLGPGGGDVDWSPKVTRFGWYEASLDITAGPAIVGSAGCAVIYAPPSAGSGKGPMDTRSTRDVSMGVALSTLTSEQISALPELLERLSLFSASLPVVVDHQFIPLSSLRPVLDRILARGSIVTLAMPTLSRELGATLRVDPIEPLVLADHDPAQWIGSLTPYLDAYGQRIPRWQFGTPPALPSWSPADLTRRLSVLRTQMERLMPGVRMTFPWSAEVAWPSPPRAANARHGALDTLTLTLPANFSPRDGAALASQWLNIARREGYELHVLVDPQTASDGVRVADADRTTDLMQRVALLWESLSMGQANSGDGSLPRLSLNDPWSTLDRDAPSSTPSPLLGVWANLNARLSGRRVVTTLTPESGITALVLAGPSVPVGRATGTIIAWSDGREGSVLRGYFSGDEQTLTAYDPFGNTSTIRPVDSNALYEIPLSATPLILEGVDIELAQFSAGFQVTPMFVPAVATIHEREIVLTNPWPVRITGEIHLPAQQVGVSRQPWRFTPSSPISFSIAPGQVARLPFAFSFSAGEEAGPRTLVANVRLSADRQYAPMRLTAPILIGLQDLDMTVAIAGSPSPEGPDLVATATVTNTGSTNRTMQIEFSAPGHARQKLPVSNLAPGESTVRKFVLRGAAKALTGRQTRMTLVDIEGLERLNRFAKVP